MGFLKHIDTIKSHTEQLHALICAQAAESVRYSVLHAVALDTAGQAQRLAPRDPERARMLYTNAAGVEQVIATKVTGVARSLLLLNACRWLLAASMLDAAHEIAVEGLQDPTLLPYIREVFEGFAADSEPLLLESLQTDLDPQSLLQEEML